MSPFRLPRPFVTANFATTTDGKITTRKRTSSIFSSARDKARLLEIRSSCDAVLVGARTLAADTMTLRVPGIAKPPVRVIVSSSGRLDPSLRVFRAAGAPIVIFSTRRMSASTRAALAAKADIFLHEAPVVNLALALAALHEDYGVRRVVCEGGGELLHSLARADLLDELHVTFCPLLFGGRGAPTITGVPGPFLPVSARLRLVESLTAGGECFTRWRVIRPRVKGKADDTFAKRPAAG